MTITIFFVCPANINAQQTLNTETLKIALLPILDAFPYYVAEAKNYFKEYAIDVKVVPVASGLERDQLMQSGVIDGMLNEMITTANFNRDRVQVKTVITARKAYPRYPLFRVLSSPAGKLTNASQWEDVMQWMMEKGLLDKPLSYDNSITSAFLP